jgi:hypothetical protein
MGFSTSASGTVSQQKIVHHGAGKQSKAGDGKTALLIDGIN